MEHTTEHNMQASLSRLFDDKRARSMLYPHTFAEYASGGEWKAWTFWRFVGRLIAKRIIEGNGRIIVNLPPGTGKSTFLAEWLPTWFLETWPTKRVIVATHSQPLADRAGRAVRNEFDENQLLRTKLAEDSTAKNQWNTTAGGGMKCVGVGASSIGFRANLFLIDDPYGSWRDAYSSTYRSELETWFDSTLRTRLEPRATVVVLHHRFAHDDLTQFLTANASEKWEVISLPAIAEANDQMGRAAGEPLCPERFSLEELVSARSAMASIIWDAMYQQTPQLIGSGACYRNFSAANIDDGLTLDVSRPLQVALDYNINPGMHAIIGQHIPESDLITAVHEVHRPRMTIGECMVEVKNIADAAGRFREWEIFADPAGTSQSASTGQSHHDTVRRFLRDHAIEYRWRVRGSHNPVIDGVNAFNDALKGTDGQPHYLIHPRCVRLINDLTKVQADDHGKPSKRYNDLTHSTDADRYRIENIRPIYGSAPMPTGTFILN